jgi:DNA-binding MarR family transcriptional regulator
MQDDDLNTSSDDPSSMRAQLRHLLRAVVMDYERCSTRVRTELGLSTNEWRALMQLVAAGPLTATDLARRTGLAGPTITALVDRLERAGMLDRSLDESDRRRRCIAATELSTRHVTLVTDELLGPLHAASEELPAEDVAGVERFVVTASRLLSDGA